MRLLSYLLKERAIFLAFRVSKRGCEFSFCSLFLWCEDFTRSK
jgi:hypothetical protein